MNIPVTRFAEINRKGAYCILAFLILIICYGLGSLNQAFPPRESKATDGEDARMYRSIIERIHAGENYYQVVGEELRTRGYASRPFFNWRLPTIAWGIGHLPNPEWGRWILVVLGFLAVFWWTQVLHRNEGFSFAAVGGILLCGTVLLCTSDKGFLYHELWASMLIAISLAAYARGSRILSVITGILALFIRELALPFVLIMAALAWIEKREREALTWLGGLAAFSLCLAYHAHVVSGLLTSMDQINESWIQLGGWPFVLRTGNWNAFLLVAPKWVIAVVLPLALLGVIGWKGEVGLRTALTLGAYCCAYLIAGRVDNSYWGIMYAPLLPLGLLFAFPSIADLWRNALGMRQRLGYVNRSPR